MKMLAIRGATTVSSNNENEILDESARLVQSIIIENNLDINNIVSICFTMTNDLDAVYPSVAVREILKIQDIPMLNFEEKYIRGSLKQCIRVMVYINSDEERKDLTHVYLNGSSKLRPDLKKNNK